MDKAAITPELVSRLIAAQFPQWAGLPVRPVDLDGWDNTTFRLGEDLSVRLPSASWYVPQVDKEHRWLPVFAGQLPLPTGEHNFYRGGPLTVYDSETKNAIAALDGGVDTGLVAEVWAAALGAPWTGPPVWVHGDVSNTNLLVDRGGLTAIIDFGCCAVGDPACDTVIAWTFLSGPSRQIFKDLLPVDEATWARGRGWALWKALIVLVRALKGDPEDARQTKHVIDEILADHQKAAHPAG